MAANHRKDDATTECCHDLRNADGTVEQTQISPHVTIALQGIGDKGKGHGQHGRPSTANKQERNELQILIMDEGYQQETDGSEDKTQRISQFCILELREQGSPHHRADCLYGKEDAHQLPAVWNDSLAGSVVSHTVSAMAPVV